MPDIPAEMQEQLEAVPEGLWSIFLPQLLQLGAHTFPVPCGVAARLDGAVATGWFWAIAIDDDCLVTTMHMATRRAFVLHEQPAMDYLVLGLLSNSDADLINDMREAQGAPGGQAEPFFGEFTPTLARNVLAFPMVHGDRYFEMPAGSLHDSCNICMLPSFVERMRETLGPAAPDLAAAMSAGLELNECERLRATMHAIDPTAASRAGAALHYRALVYEALAELASSLRESGRGGERLDLNGSRDVADAVNAALLASLAHPPTLDELADRLFMGKTRLCQAFRAETGVSIGERATELRVSEAKRRLTHGGESIAEIARSLGFAHPSSFTTMFSREVGMSPSAWRAGQRG